MIYPAASLYKLGVMVEVYRQAVSGELSLDETTVAIGSTDPDSESGGDVSAVLTIRDAVERMITISDNSSALALVGFLDPHRINKTMSGLGLGDTRLNTSLPEEERTAPYNTTSARDMAALFAGLVRGTVVGPVQSREMLAVLGRQQINDRLPAGLPAGVPIAHKTGDLSGVSHDVGVISTPSGPRVVVMLTRDYADRADVVSLAEKIAATVYGAPLDSFAARYRLSGPTAVFARPNESLLWSLEVSNASTFAWSEATVLVLRLRPVGPAGSQSLLGTVRIGRLPEGALANVRVSIQAPSSPGSYVLELEVVDPTVGLSGNRLPIVLMVTNAP